MNEVYYTGRSNQFSIFLLKSLLLEDPIGLTIASMTYATAWNKLQRHRARNSMSQIFGTVVSLSDLGNDGYES